MNNEFSTENVAETTAQSIDSIGLRLKQAREAHRLTITDVARQLRLTNATIQALENDDYHAMPGVMFTKGYLRAYAQWVDLPADELILDFDRLNPSSENKLPGFSAYKSPIQLNYKSMRWLLYCVGLVLFIILAAWWSSKSNVEITHVNEKSTLPLPAKNLPPSQTAMVMPNHNTDNSIVLPTKPQTTAGNQSPAPLTSPNVAASIDASKGTDVTNTKSLPAKAKLADKPAVAKSPSSDEVAQDLDE